MTDEVSPSSGSSSTPLFQKDLKGARIEGSCFDKAIFHSVSLADTRFEDVHGPGLRFLDANLSGTEFDDVNLQGVNIHNANMSGASLDDVDLSGATISNADVRGATLNGVPLEEALELYLKSRRK